MANAILSKVEYVTKDFDLTNPLSAFEFIFQMYNFLSDAEAENERLDRPALEPRNRSCERVYHRSVLQSKDLKSKGINRSPQRSLLSAIPVHPLGGGKTVLTVRQF